jgi:hypothetical protein
LVEIKIMGIKKGRQDVRDRKIAVLKELLKLAVAGGMAKQSQDIFKNAGQNPTTFRRDIYRDELNLVNRFAISANRQALLVQELLDSARTGIPFTIAGVHESAGLAIEWSARCKDSTTHTVLLNLKELIESRPYQNHVNTFKSWLDEYGISAAPVELPSAEFIKNRIKQLQMAANGKADCIDVDIEPEFESDEFSISEPSDHMSAREINKMLRERRHQMRGSYFEHRPDFQLNPLPPISRQTSRQIAS